MSNSTPDVTGGLLNKPQTFNEMTLDELSQILSLTIKHDKENKVVTFLAMLSAFTDSNQINISFNAPSSSGKTYIAREIASLFHADDKISLSGASPTSFFYSVGVHDEERDATIVSLERKILIFYEQPNPQLQAKLRSVLSHDDRELRYQITNKGKKGENRAQTIIIRGFAATVFCSAEQRLDEQEATRAILLSPEATEEKIHDGISLQALRDANPEEFASTIESNQLRARLRERIVAIRDEHVGNIIVPNHEAIEKRFKAMLSGGVKQRNMRDMSHLMSLIKATTLLNVWHRVDENGDVTANQSDVDQAFDLWGYFMESLGYGISPALMNFYKDFILPPYYEKKIKEMERDDYEMLYGNEPVGLSRGELCKYYLKVMHKPVNDDYLRKQCLPQLEACGLILQSPPAFGDRRSKHIYPQVMLETTENNIGNTSVPTPDAEKTDIIDTVNKIFPS